MNHLNPGYNQIQITRVAFVRTSKPDKETSLPIFVIEGLNPTNLRLQLSFDKDTLIIKSLGKTSLVQFDEEGIDTSKSEYTQEQSEAVDYYFMAVPKGQTKVVVVKLRILSTTAGWVHFAVSF